MKKILAFILVALMLLPFAVTASAAAPEEPVLTSDKAFTVAAAKDNANPNFPDLVPDKYGTKAKFWQDLFAGSLKNGGKFIIAGKGYLAENATLPATASPVVFTSVKDGVNYASFNADGTYNTVDGKGAAGGGQYGSLLLKGDVTLTFKGDVIFDDVVIFNRDNKLATLRAEGKLVIKDNVKFSEKTEGKGYTLSVAEGGVAFLHALGFINYTGNGTIVIGNEIKDKVTAETFADFGGELIYADGSKVDGFTPNPNTPADSTATTTPAGSSAPVTTAAPSDGETVTKKPTITIRKPKTEAPESESTPETTPAATDNGNSGMLVGIIIGVAAAAVIGVAVIVVTKKKTAKKD